MRRYDPAIVRSILIAVLLTAGALAPAVGASAQTTTSTTAPGDTGVGIRLVEAPSALRDDPRAQVYIVDHVAPGTTITRTIEVVNDVPDANTIALYPVAASLQNGEFAAAPGRETNELTGWMSVSPAQLDLGPRASGKAKVTIAVPDGAESGERYAAVLAELPPRPSDQPGVAVTSRVGIRVYLSVGGDEPPTSFALETFTPVRDGDSRPGIDIRACNDGGRAVDLTGELHLADGPGGTSAGPFKSDGTTSLGPGDCGTLAIRAPADLPRGPWKARATLRSGKAVESAEADLTFPEDAGTRASPVKPRRVTESTGGRLAILLALLLLLLVLLLLFLLWRRRRQREEEDDGPKPNA